MTIETIYPDAVLNWEPVTTSIYGTPLTIDCYLIFYKQVYGETFNFLALSMETNFTHEYVVQFSPSMFCEVEAYIGEIGVLEGLISSGESISRKELHTILAR